MTHKSWSPEEREEYDVLCQEAWDAARTTPGRTDAFLKLLNDAIQARRMFARDVLREAEQIGASSILKSWNKRSNRVAVTYDGQVISKPRTIGISRTDDNGKRYAIQSLFDFLTFQEIEAKIHEYLRQVLAYKENIYVATCLLELRELVPEATTPDEAVRKLGTTVEEFLAQKAA